MYIEHTWQWNQSCINTKHAELAKILATRFACEGLFETVLQNFQKRSSSFHYCGSDCSIFYLQQTWKTESFQKKTCSAF